MKRMIVAIVMMAGLVVLTGFGGSSPRELIGMAEWYSGNSEPATAQLYFDRAIAAEPRSPEGYRHRAFFYLRQQRDREALADLTTAIGYDPKAADLYASRGMLLERMQDYPEAYADYATACGLGEKGACSFAEGLRQKYHLAPAPQVAP
jgi:tetratricopeptide (TPR) repeat protein